MSADHGLERRAEERLITEIADLKRQISELRTLQQQGNDTLNITNSVTLGHVWSALLDGQEAISKFILSTTDPDAKLIAIPSIDFYETSISAANLIGHGNARDYNYTWNTWVGWHDNTGSNLVLRTSLINNTGSTQQIIAVCNWRILVNTNATISVA